MKGLLVTLEGQDGSGKSTLLQLVSEYLKAKEISVAIVPEFSSNVLGKFLKNILEKNKFLRLREVVSSALTETLYVLADLYSQDELEIRPAIKHGKVVLKERHVDSVLACQIPKIIEDYPLEDFEQLFQWLSRASAYLLEPDLTFFLKVKDETLQERIKARGELICENDFIVFAKRLAIYNRLADEKRKSWVVLCNDGNLANTAKLIVAHIHRKLI